ncbi:MAG: MFS transporter [Chloroflexi bacterium]|nr:MFS transporter [Chloroflexota bacterium]
MNVNAIAQRLAVIHALQHRDFRLYWTGNFMSVIGQQISITVQAWLIFELTGSALQLGLLGLARAAPAVVLGLAGGIAADKFSQRKLLTITIAIVGIIWTIFAALTYSGNIQVWQVLALVFAVGAVQSFQQASRQAIFPSLIDHRHMSSAVGLNSAIHPGARIFAPVLAGYLIDYLGVPMEGAGIAMYIVAAGSFIYCFMVFLTKPRNIKRAEGANGLQDLMDGLRYVRSHRIFFLIIGTSMANAFFAGSHVILAPVFADKLFGEASGSAIGYIFAAGGVGGMTGALLGGSLGSIRNKGAVLAGSALTFGGAVVAFALSPWYALLLAMEFLSAAGNELFVVVGQSILHLEVPNEYRGRVMGIWGMTYTLAQPMGSMQVGFLASAITAPLAVAISGGVACAISLLGVGRDQQIRAIGKEPRVAEIRPWGPP